MNPVRIAVIGAGLIGAKHIDYVRACPDTDLVAVVDPDPAAAETATAHDAVWFPDLDKMIGTTDVDGAIIATPTALHERVGLDCVAAGLPALVEKPLCHTIDAAERLNLAAEAAGIVLLTGHHRRYNTWAREAKRLVDNAALGRIVALSCLWSVAKPAAYFDMDWRRAPGGGPVLTNLIHEIDLMRFVIGEIDEVAAMTSSAIRGFETEDTAAVTLRFACGALGSIVLSDAAPSPWTWEQASGEAQERYRETDQNPWRIFGTEAALEFPRLRIWQQQGTPDWTKPISVTDAGVSRADVYAAQIAHFANVVRGREAPIVSGRDGQKSLAATLAVFDAAQTGRTVRL